MYAYAERAQQGFNERFWYGAQGGTSTTSWMARAATIPLAVPISCWRFRRLNLSLLVPKLHHEIVCFLAFETA